MILKVISVKRN